MMHYDDTTDDDWYTDDDDDDDDDDRDWHVLDDGAKAHLVVDEYRVKNQMEQIGRACAELTQVASKLFHLTYKLKEMHNSEYHASPRCVGREIRPLMQLARDLNFHQRKWNKELSLVNECISLRCNDPHVTRVDNTRGGISSRFRFDYGSVVVGHCLRHNTHVTELAVYLSTLNNAHLRDDKAKQYFLEHIQTSRTLQSISLSCYEMSDDDKSLARSALAAIRENPQVTKLTYHCVYIPPVEFDALMSSTTSFIKDLNIELSNWQNEYSRPEQDQLIRAICSVKLNRLRLHFQDGDEWSTVESILHHLINHTTPLLELSLRPCSKNKVSLQLVERFLQCTVTLNHFEFEYFHFDAESMSCVLDGLKAHYLKPTASMTKLSFIMCTFDNEASAMFMRYMQTPVSRVCHDRGAVLQELRMGLDTSQTMFDGKPLGNAMVSLISRAPTFGHGSGHKSAISDNGFAPSHTIRSGLKLFSLCYVRAMPDVFEAMLTNAKLIDIPSLHLSLCCIGDCWDLEEFIPQLRSLRELNLTFRVGEEIEFTLPKTFVLAIRQNCCIHTILVQDTESRSLLKPCDSRIVQACCKRNQSLPALLSRKIQLHWRSDDSIRGRGSKRPKLVLQAENYGTDLLFPLLIQAAKQIPMTRLSDVFSALLKFEVDCR